MEAILRAGEGTAGTAVTLLDLRTHSQHCAGRPDGAVSLPAGEPGNLGLLFRFKESFVDEVLERFAVDAPLVLLCEVGVVSRVAATRLANAGYGSVRVVSGGFESWSLEGLPSVDGRPVDATWPLEDQRSADEVLAEQMDKVYVQFNEEESLLDEAALSALYDGLAWAPDCPIQPQPLGVLEEIPEEGELELGDLGDSELGAGLGMGDESLEIGDLEALLAEASPMAATGGGVKAKPAAGAGGGDKGGADETVAIADSASAAEEAVDAAAVQAQAAADNALAGDQVDDDLASLIAGLDAPIRLPGGPTAHRPTPALQNGVSKPAPKRKARKQRRRSGIPPAWLVDVSDVDFAGLTSSGELSKLSVKQLKSHLYTTDADISGTKGVLVERIKESFEAAGGGTGAGGAAAGGTGGGAAAGSVGGPRMSFAATDDEGEAKELATLASLPPPAEGEALTLFDTEVGDTDGKDDALIGDVFSAM